MKTKQKCFLCDKYLFSLNFKFNGAVFCPACNDSLEREEKMFIGQINRMKEDIKRYKMMIDEGLHWLDLQIDNP